MLVGVPCSVKAKSQKVPQSSPKVTDKAAQLTFVLIETALGERRTGQVVLVKRIPNANGRVSRYGEQSAIVQGHGPHSISVSSELFNENFGRLKDDGKREAHSVFHFKSAQKRPSLTVGVVLVCCLVEVGHVPYEHVAVQAGAYQVIAIRAQHQGQNWA